MGDKKTSKQLLQEFTAKTYDEIREAKENGELIGWSTSNFPKEICQTFGLKIMYPENHSAAVAAKKGRNSLLRKGRRTWLFNGLVLVCSY